jgi:MSHA biogenesis protein MshO
MMRQRPTSPSAAGVSGFTLIELIVVIVITAIVAGFIAIFLVTPVENYLAQTQRGALTNASNLIQRNLSTDVATALPASLRTAAGGTVLEMLEVADVIGYWGPKAGGMSPAAPPGVTIAPFANSPPPLSTFSTFGQFQNASSGNNYYVAEGFNGQAAAYDPTLGVMTTSPPIITLMPNPLVNPISDTVSLSSPAQFVSLSPTRHIFLVSEPVTYLCDTTAQTLTRYDGYAVTKPQKTTAVQFVGARKALIAQRVTQCSFVVTDATSSSVDSVNSSFTIVNGSASMVLSIQAAVRELP